jgi:hypothetical protein
MFDSVNEPLDNISELVSLAIMAADAMCTTRWDHRLGTDGANHIAQWVAVVPLVADDKLGVEASQQDLGASDVVPFSLGQMQFDWATLAIDRDVDLGTETTPGTSQRLIVLPPLAPAACWWARTIVESSNKLESSESLLTDSKTRPQTPRLHQRLNLRKAEFHGPNRSGKSRHGDPVRAIQNTALRNNRLSAAVRPGSPALPGSTCLIAAHCSSEISCRRIKSPSMSQVMRNSLTQNGKILKTNVHTA